MGLPLLRVAGVEADDVIGTLAKQGAASGYDVLISTATRIWLNWWSAHRIDQHHEQYALTAPASRRNSMCFRSRSSTYLALVGDSSTIPGIPGVGPKTAAKWLSHIKLSMPYRSRRRGRRQGGLKICAMDSRCSRLSRKLATIDTALRAGRLLARRACCRRTGPFAAARTIFAAGICDRCSRHWARNSARRGSRNSRCRGRGGRCGLSTRYRRARLSQDSFAGCIGRVRSPSSPRHRSMSFDTETDSLDYMQAPSSWGWVRSPGGSRRGSGLRAARP